MGPGFAMGGGPAVRLAINAQPDRLACSHKHKPLARVQPPMTRADAIVTPSDIRYQTYDVSPLIAFRSSVTWSSSTYLPASKEQSAVLTSSRRSEQMRAAMRLARPTRTLRHPLLGSRHARALVTPPSSLVLQQQQQHVRRLQHHAQASQQPRQKQVKYLVIDGYIKWGREDLEAGGAVTAGQLYADMLVKCTPLPYAASYDLIFPADPDFELPDLSQLVLTLSLLLLLHLLHSQYHGVGWSGSSLTVYKSDDKRIVQMSDLARRCFAQGIPQFGSCFGAQLAVAVAGGVVAKNKFGKELGIARKISLTPEGRAHPMYEGKPSVFGGFTSHNDQVTHIMPGGLKLAQNAHTSVQAVSVRHQRGDFWAVQYHPEYDLHEIARLLYCRRKVSIELGFFRDMEGADAFIADLEALHSDHSRLDIAWRYGIDHDVLDDDIRTCEVKNFIKYLVLPYHRLVTTTGSESSD